ncbi:hypothetical protein H7J88_09060 [Mycolicibacterium flavescens]|uniref:Secreted protein n=1 Tax=Mycolicibacterium flavescens TaxID=1776 RepID=A0A1E3RRF5_MYCFV|nr:hypothetical protein [Mycolicibacterium flavescens]MCV7279799.1 hypothetical protein [Mycolicibacterium flavescens]ODQ92428.1 hypothetical protein BHQ18_01455 [Mycolicibacterium flavescens]
MVRRTAVALGVGLGLVALAPPAGADYTGQIVLLQSGTVRCLVNADDRAFGGGPMTVCALTNGQPWGMAPFETSKWNQRLNLAVIRGTGEFNWDRGLLPDAAQLPTAPVSVDTGAYKVNGWTIEPDGLRTRITYDSTGHGLFVNAVEVRGY